jgi:hypothetical protein
VYKPPPVFQPFCVFLLLVIVSATLGQFVIAMIFLAAAMLTLVLGSLAEWVVMEMRRGG